MYADYAYYSAAYCGSLLSEEEFGHAVRAAEAYVNALTYGRLLHGAKADNAVKSAVCAVAEAIHRSNAARTSAPVGVSATSNDGISESYRSPAELESSAAAEKLAAAELYLPRSHPLRYAGVL